MTEKRKTKRKRERRIKRKKQKGTKRRVKNKVNFWAHLLVIKMEISSTR